jgi:hypothetical protein
MMPDQRGAIGKRSAESFFEARVVAYGGKAVVPARLLAERREQLDGPLEMSTSSTSNHRRVRRDTNSGLEGQRHRRARTRG